jgi:hypothetical protein
MLLADRHFCSAACSVTILSILLSNIALAGDDEPANSPDVAGASPAIRPNMVGAYGEWLSSKVLTDGPAQLSFRTGKWKSLDEWRRIGRARVWECIAPVNLGGQPDVRVERRMNSMAFASNAYRGNFLSVRGPKQSF